MVCRIFRFLSVLNSDNPSHNNHHENMLLSAYENQSLNTMQKNCQNISLCYICFKKLNIYIFVCPLTIFFIIQVAHLCQQPVFFAVRKSCCA